MLRVAASDAIDRLTPVVARIAEQHDVSRVIAPEDHLVDSGLTSMAMVDLMLAVEAEFDVTIPHKEMTPLNFQSIGTLARMLERIHAEG